MDRMLIGPALSHHRVSIAVIKQNRDVWHMLLQCWASVADACRTLKQNRLNGWCAGISKAMSVLIASSVVSARNACSIAWRTSPLFTLARRHQLALQRRLLQKQNLPVTLWTLAALGRSASSSSRMMAPL